MIKIGKNVTIGQGLTLIAGPCVAESRELCLKVADYLRGLCADLNVQYIFKASFDKANRSSVNSFRGPGFEPALDILAEVKSKFKVPVCTDVHEISQVKKNR